MLENAQIRLRAPEPEDLDALYKWENNPELWRIGNTTAPYSRHALKRYIDELEHDIYSTGQLRFMVELKSEDKAIGTADLFDFDVFHSRSAIGLLIDENYRGNGYADQALKLLLEYGFSFLKLHQLYVEIPENNPASISLFPKNDFTLTGKLKDWVNAGEYRDVLVFQKINPLY